MDNNLKSLVFNSADKAHVKPFPKSRKNSWTPEEDAFIVEYYAQSPKDYILSGLPNRSWDAIMTRAKKTHHLTRTVKHNLGNTYRKGIPAWNKGIKWDRMRGSNNPRYKGYEYINDRGYKYVNIDNDCTNGWAAYRPEHIHIMENRLGRKLLRSKNGVGEGVHHVDGDKLNNDISNLLLYSSESEHRTMHQQLEALAFELVRKGIIKFDCETKKYYT